MADFYLLSRAGITADRITARQARRLYDNAAEREDADLEGDYESGFRFWSLSIEEHVRLIRYNVVPLYDHEVPGVAPDRPT